MLAIQIPTVLPNCPYTYLSFGKVLWCRRAADELLRNVPISLSQRIRVLIGWRHVTWLWARFLIGRKLITWSLIGWRLITWFEACVVIGESELSEPVQRIRGSELRVWVVSRDLLRRRVGKENCFQSHRLELARRLNLVQQFLRLEEIGVALLWTDNKTSLVKTSLIGKILNL